MPRSRFAPIRSLALTSAAGLAALASTPAAQCGDDVVHVSLDAGIPGPRLATPEGAAVVGTGFRLQVLGGSPNQFGLLFYSGFETPVVEPVSQGTVFPGTPTFFKPFVTDADGDAASVLSVGSLDPALCGASVVFQSVVFDGSVFELSNAMRVGVGASTGTPFEPRSREETDGHTGIGGADLDGDGILDVALFDELGFSSRLGSATDGPGPAIRSGAAFDLLGPHVIADFDGDGDPDVAAAVDGALFRRYLGDGDGTVSASTLVHVGEQLANGLAAGDVDLDGAVDVIAARFGSARLALGTGAGTFQLPTTVDVGAFQTSVTLSDLDEDGQLDAVFGLIGGLSGNPSARVAVLEGVGGGSFGPSTGVVVGTPESIVVGDANDDGDLDIVVATADPILRVFAGDGAGSFVAESNLDVGYPARQVVVQDLDLDGTNDVAFVRRLGNVFGYWRGRPGGGFDDVGDWSVTHRPVGMVLGDFDADGNVDVVTTSEVIGGPKQSGFEWMRGDGAGGFDGNERILVGTLPRALALGDLDEDGFDDVVLAGSTELYVYLGSPAGLELAQVVDLVPSFVVGALAIDEFTGDGIPDVLAMGSGGASSGVIRVYRGRGDGPGILGLFTDSPAGPSATRVDVADLDEDGVLDLLFAQLGSPLSVRLGLGNGLFGPATTVPGSDYGSNVLADFDGDGNLDVAGTDVAGVFWHAGNGDGTFGGPISVAPPGFYTLVGASDLDGDGFVDLAGTIGAFFGDGTGNFTGPVVTLLAELGPRSAADADGDGDVDLLRLNVFADDLQFFRRDGTGAFALSQSIPMPGASDPLLGDVDGDGIVDVVALDDGELGLIVVRNRLGE